MNTNIDIAVNEFTTIECQLILGRHEIWWNASLRKLDVKCVNEHPEIVIYNRSLNVFAYGETFIYVLAEARRMLREKLGIVDEPVQMSVKIDGRLVKRLATLSGRRVASITKPLNPDNRASTHVEHSAPGETPDDPPASG